MAISQTPELLNHQQMDVLRQRTRLLWQKLKDEKPAALFFLDISAREFSFQLKVFNRNQAEPLKIPPEYPLNFGSEKTELFTSFLLDKERNFKQVQNLSEEDQIIKSHLQKHARILRALRTVDIDHIRSFVKPATYKELIAPFCSRETLVSIYGEENILKFEEVLKKIACDNPRLIIDDVTYTGFSIVLLSSILATLDPTHEYRFFEMFNESTMKQFTGENLYLPWTRSGNQHYESSQLISEPKDSRSFVSQLVKDRRQRERAVRLRMAIRTHFSNKSDI